MSLTCAFRYALPLAAAVACAHADSSGMLGTIPTGSIQVEGGCTHYLEPVKSPEDYENRIVFHWRYPELHPRTGKCHSDCLPYMHLLGRLVPVIPETPWPEDMLNGKEVGDTFTEIYRFDSIEVRFHNRITFVCPPEHLRMDVCEVIRFVGSLSLSNGRSKETYLTTGACGM